MRPYFSGIKKNIDNFVFRAKERITEKNDLNNTDYDTFQEIIVSLPKVYAPLKKKYLSKSSFVTKELLIAIM